MKIVWLSWKDRKHPLAGGAETVSGEIMDRLVRDGHQVKLITAHYPHSEENDTLNGVEILRTGNRYTVYQNAKHLFKRQLADWPDVVIDEMNTIPFRSADYSDAKNVLLCYQLAREVWFYQMPFPISLLGFTAEPFMLRTLAKKYSVTATESKSTQIDLEKYGFNNVHVFRVGIDLPATDSLAVKSDKTLVLSLGALRPMKRTLEAVKAFEVARDQNPALHMIIAGDTSSSYAKSVIKYTKQSRHCDAVNIEGRVSRARRLELMQQAGVILVTSVKEGWGLIVTEANSQGTPAIVYDADGLRDSVQNDVTGIVTPENSTAMGDAIVNLLTNDKRYEIMRQTAWQFSKQFTFDNSYQDFLKIISDEPTPPFA